MRGGLPRAALGDPEQLLAVPWTPGVGTWVLRTEDTYPSQSRRASHIEGRWHRHRPATLEVVGRRLTRSPASADLGTISLGWGLEPRQPIEAAGPALGLRSASPASDRDLS